MIARPAARCTSRALSPLGRGWGRGVIRKTVAHLSPWRIALCRGAWQTLELAAGEIHRQGLRAGLSLSACLATHHQEPCA
jgi:hypothetical protein